LRIELRPAFREAVRRADRPLRRAALKTVEQLLALEDLNALHSHHGLRFEKIHGLTDPASGEQLYSLRISRGVRTLVCLAEGPTVILVSRYAQHDKTYRKR
jgi:hypothetical protein